MADLKELKEKLELSKQKLVALNKLLRENPDNETLQSRKGDLEEVISLTEKLLKVKKERAIEEIADDHRRRKQQRSEEDRNRAEDRRKREVPRHYGVRKEHYEIGERCQIKHRGQWFIAEVVSEETSEPDWHSRPHSVTSSSISNSGNSSHTNSIVDTHSLSESSEAARITGLHSIHDETGDSEQPNFNDFLRGNTERHGQGSPGNVASLLRMNEKRRLDDDDSDSVEYRLRFLDRRALREFGEFCVAKPSNMRTYVPPLPTELSEGMRVKCVWSGDGFFHRGTLSRIVRAQQDSSSLVSRALSSRDDHLSAAVTHYQIVFDKWEHNEAYFAPLYDIQVVRSQMMNGVGSSSGNTSGIPSSLDKSGTKSAAAMAAAAVTRDKRGRLHISEKPEIPEYLWQRRAETKDGHQGRVLETKEEMRVRQKRIKQLKKKHKEMVSEVAALNRTHDWRQFLTKGMRKSKKKLNSTLVPTVTDKESLPATQSRGFTEFRSRTHFHHLKKNPR